MIFVDTGAWYAAAVIGEQSLPRITELFGTPQARYEFTEQMYDTLRDFIYIVYATDVLLEQLHEFCCANTAKASL